MSLRLAQGTLPAGLEIKTHSPAIMGNVVFLGEYEITMEDFLACAWYVLTNTDLGLNDPRPDFVWKVKGLKETEGYNLDGRRLAVLAGD